MKFEKKVLKDHQVELKVNFEQATFDQYKTRAARKISKKNKIQGFRPGKAPIDVVQRIYGEGYINEEALELLVNDKYSSLLDEAEVTPGAMGKLDEVKKLDPPELVFIVPLEPTVDLGKYTDIRKEYKLPSITKKDINAVIHNLQLNAATAETAERAADKGDLVNIKLSATINNPDEGESDSLLKDSPYQMIIGEKLPDDFPFKGFDKELIGLKAKYKKDVTHKYPKKSPFEKLQGKEVTFNVEVSNVKELTLPEVNEEFVKNVSMLDSIEMLEMSIKNQLTHQKNQEYEEQYYNDLIEQIVKGAKIAYPPQILEQEVEHVLHDFEHNLSHQNMDLDTFLKLNKLEKEEFLEKEINPAAVRQLEHSLVLEQVSKDENIELEQNDLEQVYRQTMYEYQMRDDFKKIKRELSPKKLANSVLMQAASRLMNRQVLQRLKYIANDEEAKEKAAAEAAAAEEAKKKESEKETESKSEKPVEKSEKKEDSEKEE